MSVEIPIEYTTPEGIRTLINYLRSTIKIRSGILFEKRVDYFKGKRFVETLMEQKGKWPKTLTKITDIKIAQAIGEVIMNNNEKSYFVRVERVDDDKGILMVILCIYIFIFVFYIIIMINIIK